VRFYEVLDRVDSSAPTAADSRIKSLADAFVNNFDEAMSDDFNTARAIAGLHELTTEINRTMDDNPAVTAEDQAALRSAVSLVAGVLGILEEDPKGFLEQIKRSGLGETGLSESEIEDLIAQRNAARKAKDFKRADEVRDMLKEKGIQLKDTPAGTIWEKIQ
jgi:cysteinyl-tRNA synthetase